MLTSPGPIRAEGEDYLDIFLVFATGSGYTSPTLIVDNIRLNTVPDRRLAAEVAEDAVVAKLRTFSGIGPITATTMRAEIGQFERFHSGKQLARYCALSPQNASNGQRQADAGLVRAGNRQLRAVLIEAAHRFIEGTRARHD